MRYEKKSTILTTNINFTDWDSVFYDAVVANAILDRVLHHSHVVTINESGQLYCHPDSLIIFIHISWDFGISFYHKLLGVYLTVTIMTIFLASSIRYTIVKFFTKS